MNSVKATLHTFERKSLASDATGARRGLPEPAVVGAAGIGWGQDFQLPRQEGRGDQARRRQAHAGRHFPPRSDRSASSREDHRLYCGCQPGQSFCVDDPASAALRQDRRKSSPPRGPRAARTWRQSRPISAASSSTIRRCAAPRPARVSSCTCGTGDSVGTYGRVGLPEERVAALQDWSGKGFTAIAIVTEDAAPRFKGCLPLGNSPRAATDRPAALPLPHPRREHKDQRASLTSEWGAPPSAPFISGSDRKD